MQNFKSAALVVLAVGVVGLVAVSFTLSSSSPDTLLSKPDNLNAFLLHAKQNLDLLERELPHGLVARKYPAQEREIATLFRQGEMKLAAVAQQVKAAQKQETARANSIAQYKHFVRRANKYPTLVAQADLPDEPVHHRATSANHNHAALSSLAQLQSDEKAIKAMVDRTKAQMSALSHQLPAKDAKMFPTEAKELRSVLQSSEAQLSHIDAEMKQEAADKLSSLVLQEAADTKLSSLASAKAVQNTKISAQMQKMLDHDKKADDDDSKALSHDDDAGDVLGAINSLPVAKKADSKAKSPLSTKARLQSLANADDALEAKPKRQWGSVYDPTARKGQLTGLARKEYAHWSAEVDKMNSVYDPMADNKPRVRDIKQDGDWWNYKHYSISGKEGMHHSGDQWWEHDHAGRGY